MTPQLPLVDVVRELTQSTSHREEYVLVRDNHDGSKTLIEQGHVTQSLSLIAQLRVAIVHSATSDVGGRPGFMSKPSARLDALDALLRIDQGATAWIHHLTGHPLELAKKDGPDRQCAAVIGWGLRCHTRVPTTRVTCPAHGNRRNQPRVDVDAPTEKLVHALASLVNDNDQVERDMRSWWLHARIVTGWDTPPFRPNNTCPTCHKRGGLRVRLDPKIGLCVECKSQWTEEDDTFRILAWHVRVQNNDTEGVSA